MSLRSLLRRLFNLSLSMDNMEQRRHYVRFDPALGYLGGPQLFYECLLCGDVVPSIPPKPTDCQCRNIIVDIDAGRMNIRDHTSARLFEMK